MKLLTRYILKEHFLPFLYALLIVIFLLFTNFLLRAVDRFLGKGLPIDIILEYLLLNTAWIIALAAPVAVLVATLMAFGRFAEDNEITALRSSGVSFTRILWPALTFSILVAVPLMMFNNTVLPHMNHNARMLARDIYRKRPDLNVEAGYFIDDLPQYSFIVKGKKGNRYQDVHIYGKDRTVTQTSIRAEEATFRPLDDAILVTLYDGEIHEVEVTNYQNYRRIIFDRHRIIIPAEDLTLQRRETGSRSDREMTLNMIHEKISGYSERVSAIEERIEKEFEFNFPDTPIPPTMEDLIIMVKNQKEIEKEETISDPNRPISKSQDLENLSMRVRTDYQMIAGYERSINRYTVEIHKKFSLPSACIVFVLVGAPLGIMTRKGGFFTAIIFSFGFVLLYYLFLIGGEEMADRNYLHGAIAMWMPNIVLGAVGIVMTYQATRERTAFQLPSSRKKGKKHSK
ncbi:MAG TPA: YjgP/YjgQ family permease [Candidatus Marinimicrobia bacterium]|nr:YjgP/YjgQ family permease [Candidatus Neomarinimicrobiota bacterium]HIO89090.1 YjgP/YjgQ family permease [Candidatus Neomarinimicrobiota bacterium]